MVEEVQRQKQKPKRKVDSRIKDALKNSGVIRRLIDQLKIEEEINPDLSQGPAKVTLDPSDEESMKNFKKRAKLYESAKGGMIKKYKKGGSVKKNKMATTKGWGASRKT